MAVENPYAAPAASVANPMLEVPENIRKKIKQGWVAALVSAGITLVVTLIAMTGTEIMGFSAWELIDVGLILGLAFGIYKKSRTCAVLMLVYFIIAKIIIIADTGKASGLPMAVVFAYFFWQGIAGTFAYHRYAKRGTPLAATSG